LPARLRGPHCPATRLLFFLFLPLPFPCFFGIIYAPTLSLFFLIMQIYWHGFSCVRIESTSSDKEATLVTDPYEYEDTGLRFPRTLEPQVVVLSNQDAKKFPMDNFKNKPFVISDPGEYEVQGLFVFGMALPNAEEKGSRDLVYRFEIEGISIGFIGSLKRALHEEELSRLEDIDILLLPVGGQDGTVKQAIETINVIEPRIVIPMGFHVEGIKQKLGTVDAFCKELGVCKRQDANKLKISRKDLPADDMVITVLERS
jgi:hypothetical protein